MINKKYLIIFIVFFTFSLIFFIFFTYRNYKFGNNISKSDNADILNISSYDSIIEVTVYSNKNTNKYVISQKYSAPNILKQEVIEPESIKGLTTTYDGKNLIIQNKMLDIETFYENYNYLGGNNISLISFIQDYKNNEAIETFNNENEIIIKIKLKSNNKYQMYKKLYLDKNNKMPIKMEILDFNQKTTVYILYREIRINKTNKEEVLAKK